MKGFAAPPGAGGKQESRPTELEQPSVQVEDMVGPPVARVAAIPTATSGFQAQVSALVFPHALCMHMGKAGEEEPLAQRHTGHVTRALSFWSHQERTDQ